MKVKRSERSPGSPWSVFIITILYLLILYALHVIGNFYPTTDRFDYVSVEILITSMLIYFLLVKIVQFCGGLGSPEEERLLYTGIMGIAIILFATTSQIHNGIIGAELILLMAVLIGLSISFRFVSSLPKFKGQSNRISYLPTWDKNKRVGEILSFTAWILILYVTLLGFYILAFTPVS